MRGSARLTAIVAATLEFGFLAGSLVLLPVAVSALELPAGTVLEARLSGPTGSRISHTGDSIEATIIAPVSVEGRILVPQGSRLLGSITKATALGLGLKHATASIGYAFHTLLLPGETAVPVNAQLVEVDTAKEHVDHLGTVNGVYPIVSLSSGVAYFAVPLLLANPTIGAPIWGVKSLLAPSANPEIRFPTGTEIILTLSTELILPEPKTTFPVPAKSFSPDDLTDIDQLLKNSAQRALMGGRPSDIVNVLFLGSRSQLDRAFLASGWFQAQPKSPISLYRMYLALTKRSGYPRAPTNALTLNGVPSEFVQQKSLDTVQKRHHVRVWQYPQRPDVWLGAAAEDIGFRFKLTHWTHSTDPHIDSERAKVVNDLAFIGCLNSAGLLSRTSADLVQDPNAEYPILTDGDIAVVRLNDCVQPNPMAGAEGKFGFHSQGPMVRALAGLRDDLVRSNIVFMTYTTLKALGKHKTASAAPPTPVTGEPRELNWLVPTTPR